MNHARKNMGSGDSERRFAGLAFLMALVGVPACASLLGIEDIHEDQSANGGSGNSTSGSGNSTSEGGKSNPGGGANQSGGANPTAGDAGEGPSGGASPGGTSGAGGASGGSAGGTAGSSGAAGAGGAGTSVHGHVIDFWGHKLSAVPVQIGKSQVMTDTEGGFTIPNAPAQYDVSLVVSFTEFSRLKTRGWVYQGLTRRDPTLQVYDGLPELEGPLNVRPNNPAALTDTRTLTVALGGPDVTQTSYDVSGPGTDGASVFWVGPPTTQVTAHALIWENDSAGLPATFLAYDSTLVGLSSVVMTPATASFNLSAAATIPTGTVAGTVAGADLTGRTNSVFVRFASNAVMQLLSAQPSTPGFVYTVPTLANATVTMAAARGDLNTQYALVHRDGLLANSAMINLAIPTPAKALAVIPASDLNKVSATTQFGFTAASSSAPFVAVLTGVDPSVSDDRLYVVGGKAPFVLPKVVDGLYTLQAGASYIFRVETHGAPATVDDMAGPSGFLDAFSASSNDDSPAGPRTGDGSYTLSTVLNVKAAP